MFIVPYPLHSWIPKAPADVTIYITELLDIHALVRVRLTCSDGDAYVSATLCRRMRILIKPYFKRYWDFVQEMRFTGAVIGGQMAMNILYPRLYSPTAITIYLPNRLFFHMLGYLCHVEGYAVELANQQGDHRSVQRRTRSAILSCGENRIELFQSTSDSPLYALLGGWNTALPMYVTPTGFCDPYPLLTRAKRALVDTRHLRGVSGLKQTTRDSMAEWRARGWSIAVHPRVWDAARGACAQEPRSDCAAAARYFGDKHCVAGPLLPVRSRTKLTVCAAQATDFVEEYTVCWWRGGRVCGAGCHGDLLAVTPGASTVLRRLVDGE